MSLDTKHRSNRINHSKIEKLENFTHFTPKITHISGVKFVQISIVTIVTVYIYTNTVALHFTFLLIFLSPSQVVLNFPLFSSSSKAFAFSISHTLSLSKQQSSMPSFERSSPWFCFSGLGVGDHTKIFYHLHSWASKFF